MSTLELQTSIAQTIYSINDLAILEQVKKAIKNIVSIKTKTASQDLELTPFVKKMCTGHGIDDVLDDKKVLEDELIKKYL